MRHFRIFILNGHGCGGLAGMRVRMPGTATYQRKRPHGTYSLASQTRSIENPAVSWVWRTGLPWRRLRRKTK